MRVDKKMLLLAPFAVGLLMAADNYTHQPSDAELRYKAKYGRWYPKTERQKMEAARKQADSDTKVAAKQKESSKQDVETSRTSDEKSPTTESDRVERSDR